MTKTLSIIATILLLVNTYYPQKIDIDRELKKVCVYPCEFLHLEGDTILVNSKERFFSKDPKVLKLEELNNLDKIVKEQSYNRQLLWVYEYPVQDGTQAAMLKINDKYGLLFDLFGNDFLAYNLLLKGIKKVNLDSDEKILEYVDFLLHLSSFPYVGCYRVNKPEDIWVYPQYIFNRYDKNSEEKYAYESVKMFNPDLLIEKVKIDDSTVDKKLNTFKNFILYSDTLRSIIKPVGIIRKKNLIIVRTYVAARGNQDISFCEFTLEKNGRIRSIAKRIRVRDMGYDFREYEFL